MRRYLFITVVVFTLISAAPLIPTVGALCRFGNLIRADASADALAGAHASHSGFAQYKCNSAGSAHGGTAIASVTLTGEAVNASAKAIGGVGNIQAGTGAGSALATANASGSSGTISAEAGSSLQNSLVFGVSTSTSGTVDGTSSMEARSAIGGIEPGFLTTDQGVAIATGMTGSAITAADTAVAAVLAKNSAIETAFGASPEFWSLGELGGRNSSVAATQTVTSSLDLAVDLTQSQRKDLLVGLYNPVVTGPIAGVTDVTLDIYANGVDVEHQDFASAAAAKSFFTDDPLDLGSARGSRHPRGE